MKNTSRYFRMISIIVLAFVLLSTPVRPARSEGEKALTSAVRVTPPAPVFDEGKRLAELGERRARVARTIGPKAILILFSAEPRVYTNDVDYEYRQENNLYYLTGLKQKGATLVLMPGNPQMPELLFLPRRNPRSETWTGHMYSPGEARQTSGINEIWEAGEFEPFMRALRTRQAYRPKTEALLLSSAGASRPDIPAETVRPLPAQNAANTPPAGYESLFAAIGKGEAELYLLVPAEGESREYRQEQNFAALWAKSATGFNVRNASPIFAQMRLRKSPMELELLQHAIDITIEAHERAQTVANRAQWEYEVDSEVVYTYKRRNADHWGYPSIVGCGPSATTLHYIDSQAPVKPGDLLLMDVGAEYDHYTADVTRTFPVNGKFSPLQAEVYQIVYDAQEAAAKQVRPGATIAAVQMAATEVIKNGLLKLGLITDLNSSQYRVWYMHGSSHWLGMNVHDVGEYSTPLEPGMVFTNEPGIYVRLDALENLPKTPENEKFIAAVRPAFEKYKGIGVRIEDDIVVTADGCQWMTAALPRSITDIETFIAKARRERLR